MFVVDRPFIVNYMPKYIEVLGSSIKMQLEGHSEMENAAIRRFKELDDRLYENKPCLRWRHFLESDVMVRMLYVCLHWLMFFLFMHICDRVM